MTVRTAVAAAAKELTKPDITLPSTWGTFAGPPDVFQAEVMTVITEHGYVYGKPPLLGRTSELKQDSSHRAFTITGQRVRPNGKLPVPVNEAQILCVTSPIRPGESTAQTSLVTVELKKGKLTPELAGALATIRTHLEPWFVTK